MRRPPAPAVLTLAEGLVLALLLSACGSKPQSEKSGAPILQPKPDAAPAQPLQGEQRWLEDWFRGTPVVIVGEAQGSLRIEVPLRNSFDAGRVEIKPPLDAVLVRVATSMRRQPTAVVHLIAPRDAQGESSLSLDRGDKVSDRLVSLGIAPQRIASVLVGGPTVMQMRLALPGAPAAARPPPPAAR
jgi:outer membrane protein OmpA-like peptidoglycan-associated protein